MKLLNWIRRKLGHNLGKEEYAVCRPHKRKRSYLDAGPGQGRSSRVGAGQDKSSRTEERRGPISNTGRLVYRDTQCPATYDEVDLALENFHIHVRREVLLDIPFELTVVVPRAEITKKYQDGRLVETSAIYSSITVSHAPRFREGA